MSPAMAAAAALTGKLADVRKFLRADIAATTGGTAQIKVTSAFDYLTDPVLPSPLPQAVEAPSTDTPVTLPPADSASTIPKFVVVKGIAAPLDIENVDTDMIIPKQFLKTLKRTGLGNALFHTLRKDPKTGESTDFVLNKAPYDKAVILVCTGANFGCGSSREHAPWSLNDFGIRTIIAPSFAEIFKTNSMQNGMVPITLSPEECAELADDARAGKELAVDLDKLEVRREGGKPPIPFHVDPFRRHCLLNGLDDIGLTLQKGDAIDTFESRRSETWPWLDGFGYAKGGRVVPAAVKERKKMDW